MVVEEEEEEEAEVDWDLPWALPLGSVVWCKMRGYPWWPAEVVPPATDDKDIASMRNHLQCFVRFFGWGKMSWGWFARDCVLPWQDGVEQGLNGVKLSGKAKKDEKKLRTAEREAWSAFGSRGKPPLPPPPWWREMCQHCDAEESDEDGGDEEKLDSLGSRRTTRQRATRDAAGRAEQQEEEQSVEAAPAASRLPPPPSQTSEEAELCAKQAIESGKGMQVRGVGRG